MKTIYQMALIVIYILLGAYFCAYTDYLLSIISYILATMVIRDLLTYEFRMQTVLLYDYKELDYN